MDREEGEEHEYIGVYNELDQMYNRHPGTDQMLLEGDKSLNVFVKRRGAWFHETFLVTKQLNAQARDKNMHTNIQMPL